MIKPFCEILCSPDAAKEIGLKRRGWKLTKAEFGFENWELQREPKRKTTLNLRGNPGVMVIKF
jgi:hypothetical protein